MFRLKDLFADAKAAAAMVLKILDNIVRNPDQPKYWRININNEEFNTVVWQYEGGRELLMAGLAAYRQLQREEGADRGGNQKLYWFTEAAYRGQRGEC